MNEKVNLNRIRDVFDESLHSDKILFLDSSPEIGEIIYADSSMTKNSKEKTSFERNKSSVLYFLVCLFIGLIISFGIFSTGKVTENDVWIPICPTILFLLLGVLLVVGQRYGETYSLCYIGTDGAEWFEVKGNRSNITEAKRLIYGNLTDLKKSIKIHYSKYGKYSHTSFEYWWYKNDLLECKISGTFHENEPKINESLKTLNLGRAFSSNGKYFFCKKVEEIWTNHILYRYSENLETNGYVDFNLLGYKYLRLGLNYIELISTGDEVKRIDNKAMDKIIIDNGMLKIRGDDFKEGWIKNAGNELLIPLEDLSNAQVFVILVSKLFY